MIPPERESREGALRQIVESHGTFSLWHYTKAKNLPGIFREGYIYCRDEILKRHIEVELDHFYGDEEKEEVLARFVCCSFMPPWGMMKEEMEQLAVVKIDKSVIWQPDTCFCPGWSPRMEFDAREIITWTTPEHLEAVYLNETYLTKNGAEVLIPDLIEIDKIEGIIFWDEESRDEYKNKCKEALKYSPTSLEHPINLVVDKSRFPRQWQESKPPWEDKDEPRI